jgi:hypothetical protein
MLPVLCGEIIERQHYIAILVQAFSGLFVFDPIAGAAASAPARGVLLVV